MKNIFKNVNFKKLGKVAGIIFACIFLFCAFSVLTVLAFQSHYADKVYPNVTFLGEDLSGKTIDQAKSQITNKVEKYLSEPFSYTYQTSNLSIIPQKENLASVNIDQAVFEAYKIGRDKDFLSNLIDQFNCLVLGKEIPLSYQLDNEKLVSLLKASFSKYEQNAVNAQINIKKDYAIEIIPDIEGKTFNYEDIYKQTDAKFKTFSPVFISLEIKNSQADIKSSSLVGKEDEIKQIVMLEPIVFNYKDKKWEIKAEEYKDWLAYETKDKDNIQLIFSEKLIYPKLSSINDEIKQEPIDAKFKIENNKVAEFVPSQSGIALNIGKTTARLSQEVIINKNKNIELAVDEVLAEITTDSINDLGIKELIGVGESNFSGSPTNRRHNIKVGTNALNGILIKPGEEFSLMTTLGDIDGKAGYLPELVIKGNKTVPEYGGGLCQVATTMFRVAVNTGLPITERKEHKYRVVYYEPAGFDATVYDPSPDMKFINDTGHYILIQTNINGNILKYEFYGTNDKRKVEVSNPVIYNITYPGPTKMVETTDLAPGVKKCTESAHNGADAYFTRKITYGDGQIKEDRWDSHYVAWSAVCQIGVEKTTSDATAAAPQNSI